MNLSAAHVSGRRSTGWRSSGRRSRWLLVAGTVALAIGVPVGLAASSPASAAVSCRVDHAVVSQWPGGFVANVTITNSGTAVNGWTLTWTYPGDQKIDSAWNATVVQQGSSVTAKNADYNGSIASGTTTSFGVHGTTTGTTNPAPARYALNGITCGSSSGGNGGGSASSSTTATARTTATTRTTAPTTATASTTGPAGSWAQCSSDQWAKITDGSYTLYNNIWGGGAGTQQLCANGHSNWRVVATHPETSGVKSYPNASLTLNRKLSSMKSLTSSFDVSVPSGGSYSTAYDLWADNNAYEVMVWMNKAGAVGPIAGSYDANGAVPSASNVSAGGHTWNIYRGSNGSNAVYSFVRTSDTTSGTVDLLALFTWLKTNGWWGDVTLGQQQFGYEITGAPGGLTFTTKSYDLRYS
ncbi:MAG: hypothetical protein QG671_2031 [Actinomycetota bacterium]|nr:hypothetical protein [Actinomycetota bacterium]